MAAGEFQSGRWMILLATEWIQAFTGTNFDFSSYSSELKAAMGISQVQLNYLAVASDLGKAFGWSSGLALIHFPLPAVLLLAAGVGGAAYGAQWLLITSRISLSYVPVFMACLFAGLSICWFNTICFVLCIRHFPDYRSLALSLTVSFNGISAALYTLAVNSLNGSPSSYLLLNAVIPILTSLTVLLPILRHSPSSSPTITARPRDRHVFLVLNAVAFLTGIYLLLLSPTVKNPYISRIHLTGAVIFLAVPVIAVYYIYTPENSESQNQLMMPNGDGEDNAEFDGGNGCLGHWINGSIAMDRIEFLGEEHGARRLIGRVDFWIYYVAYFCGGTLGVVYSNNLGQIAQSLGRQSETSLLVNVYSSCSFFGRLISAAPDLLNRKVRFARTGWMSVALVPMPLAFFLLAKEPENISVLLTGTALVGLSSGFIFAGAVSVTSELFGASSFGVNHNIVITNIPLGSLLYGLLAAIEYDANGRLKVGNLLDSTVVCMGQRCYSNTFVVWGGISMVGLVCSFVLYLRTRAAYEHRQIPRPMDGMKPI